MAIHNNRSASDGRFLLNRLCTCHRQHYGCGFQNRACAWFGQGIYAEVAVSPSMMATTAEADTLKAFIPDLVTAICDCVQPVSDQCLAKGLISETTRRQVLESRGTSNEQARTLILGVQNSTKTDGGCFEVFLDILNEILPYRVKEKLLSEMRKDLTDRAAMRKAVIPASQSTRFMLEDDHLQRIKQQGFLFGKYESSMKSMHMLLPKRLYVRNLYKIRQKKVGD